MNMPAGTRFLGGCHPHRPGKAAGVGHAHAAPYPDSWTILREAVQRPPRVFRLAGRVRNPPCALQNSPGMTSYWAFRPSPMGPMQNCCWGLRARTETSTYPGWCMCVPTPAPILRPQDHCKSAQVWVGAPNRQLLLHQKGTHTQPTQSTRTPGTPRGRHGRYARQGSWVGEPGAGVWPIWLCVVGARNRRKSPTNTGGRSMRALKTPGPPPE